MVQTITRGWQRGALGVASAALIIALGIVALRVGAETGPLDSTRQFVNEALQIIADRGAPASERADRLKALLEPHFDFAEMARQALGPHWRSLTPQQRQEFAGVFKGFIENAYLSKIRDYTGQQVEFVKQGSLGDGYAQVNSNIVQPGKAPIPVNYLLERESSDWKIYDVTVDNVSIIQNYRNQFNRVINEDGFDKLLADLKAKRQELNISKAG